MTSRSAPARSPRHGAARARPQAVARRLCAALAPALRRPLWREPQPPALLPPVPGDPEAQPARHAGALPGLPRRPSASIPTLHDIRFVEDDWENPTVGAWGLGWEVWCDGMEISQYTYFQQVGGLDVSPGGRRADLRPGAASPSICRARTASTTSPSTIRRARTTRPMARSTWRTSASSPPSSRRSPTSACCAPVRRHGGGGARPARRARAAGPAAGAAGLRPRAEGLAPVQPDGRARARSPWPSGQSYIGRIRDLCKACAEAWLALEAATTGPHGRSGCSNSSARKSPRACRRAPRATSSAWRARAWRGAGLRSSRSEAFAGPRRLTLVRGRPARPSSRTAPRSARAPGSPRPRRRSPVSCGPPASPRAARGARRVSGSPPWPSRPSDGGGARRARRRRSCADFPGRSR